jgi:hypothetical protein
MTTFARYGEDMGGNRWVSRLLECAYLVTM